ncbi:TPR-like protein [Coccomyxa subellipsoidea C-169]|uniref:TPR-like protein n=1 Tax=Coccomyxa subellipsoidea (strain C-169) TaxID=574566 RepID=I0YXR9_COCSC|nr:TPR-like protein [Coccomyxa subellipsoidea C-169]EIE23188.1 TPR-like protein [Coccomyxa subellipsoidea C-169]|eukprot:XP_005647732.1 TPR-like protein [Coccomyxa subellipsoidea C-169]
MGSNAAEPYSEMEGHFVACIQESLSLYLYENAQFLGERLVAAFPKQAHFLLLATCYFRSDQVHRAYHLLVANCSDSQSRYLLAQCCLRLGKLNEAEQALNPDGDPQKGEVPHGAAGYYLLGKICALSNRHDTAIHYYAAALTLDPLLWCAYEELCNLGADAKAAGLLNRGRESESAAASPSGISSSHAEAATPFTMQRASADSMMASGGWPPRNNRCPAFDDPLSPIEPTMPPTRHPNTAYGFPTQEHAQNGLMTPATGSSGSFVTPSQMGSAGTMPPPVHRGGPGAPGRGLPPSTGNDRGGCGFPLGMGGSKLAAGLRFTPGTAGRPPAQSVARNAPGQGPPQMPARPRGQPRGGRGSERDKSPRQPEPSGRLFEGPATLARRSSRVAPAPTAEHLATPGMSPADTIMWGGGLDYAGAKLWAGQKTVNGQAAVLSLLQRLGEGYRHLAMYRCAEAVEAFARLPAAQYSTSWVLCCIGRAYYEMVDYPQAARVFEWARQVDPTRLQGMEVYSTVLWHLKREVDLAHLAQEATAWDRRSPHAWTIMGNCFSLQKARRPGSRSLLLSHRPEHETALRFFQRALQLDPAFPYAYTLCGHEYFANEDFDRAKACYENAIRLDRRHYNAWYGIGQIEYRQEKFEMAAFNFKFALNLNGRSSVLRCNLGMALAKMGKPAEALAHMDKAIAADPANPLARFERAGVLLAQERFVDALAELEALRDIAPREASVWFQMGKIYKRLDRPDEALQHLCHALDLKPSSGDANLIKAAIEKLRQSDEADEEEM